MCYIKINDEITSKEDVRNLITGIILRQRNAYKKDDILESVLFYSKGSSIEIDKNDILQLIDTSLDVFKRNGEVNCWNGIYRTAGIN